MNVRDSARPSNRRTRGSNRKMRNPSFSGARVYAHANVRAIIALLIVAISLLPTVLVWVR